MDGWMDGWMEGSQVFTDANYEGYPFLELMLHKNIYNAFCNLLFYAYIITSSGWRQNIYFIPKQ